MRGLPRQVGLATCWMMLCVSAQVRADVRIKDITDIEGARGNPLIGVGLVVGLEGTGSKGLFTQQVAVDMLQRFNISSKIISDQRGENVFKSGNIAVVMVTADLGPFSRRGSKVDVTVSVLDDSTSLQGGTLLMTPLRGADGVDYAVAQGPISVGGFLFSASGTGNLGASASSSVQKNHPTVGVISNGATVECEARGRIVCNGALRLLLRAPDYNTSRAVAAVINTRFPTCAVPVDAGAIQVFVPRPLELDLVGFVGEIGILEVVPDMPARVVINERTGTVVAGENVKIALTAVTQGNLAITTSDQPEASQPQPFADGKTAILPRTQVGVSEQGGTVRILPRTVTVAELARALNALGVTPRDLINIFTALKRLGALHAELVIM